jgi:RNA polymerase sigma factor (TIGR02999 family)
LKSSSDTPIDALFATVYDQLRNAAHSARLRSRSDTLNTTTLVHELYLRMRKSGGAEFAGKAHFFAYAGRALRSIMVDHARARIAERARVSEIAAIDAIVLSPETMSLSLSPTQALGLDGALKLLELDDARAAKVVELHFFAGLSLAEIAEHLTLTTRTIDRDWRYARAFLNAALRDQLP